MPCRLSIKGILFGMVMLCTKQHWIQWVIKLWVQRNKQNQKQCISYTIFYWKCTEYWYGMYVMRKAEYIDDTDVQKCIYVCAASVGEGWVQELYTLYACYTIRWYFCECGPCTEAAFLRSLPVFQEQAGPQLSQSAAPGSRRMGDYQIWINKQ